MDGSVGLPVAANWEQWAQGGFMPPLGAGSGPTGPLASTPGAPPAIDPATPAGAGSLSPATLNQTTPAPLDPSVDPSGMYVPPAAVPTKAQAESANPLRSFGSTLLPALVSPPPPAPVTPAPEAPPTPKAPVLAAAQAAMPPAGVDRNGTAPAVTPAVASAPAPVVPEVAPAAPAAAPVVAPTDGANLARGMRNNNPLNLEYRDGQPYTNGQDGRFGTYPDMASGVAANTRQLLLNQDAGLQTVRQQVTHWVSDPKADLTSYIADISKALGVGPDDKIDVRNPDVASKFILAAQPHESGPTTLDPNVVKQGVVMGLDAKTWKPGTATMVAGPGGTTAAPPVATTPGAATPDPYTPLEMPFDPASLTMPRGSGLLALASGLLSGPNFSQGLGKGLQAMNNVTAQDLQGKRAANTQTAEINSANYRNQYMQAMLGIREAPKQFGQPILGSDGKTMLQPMRDGAGNVTYQPLPGTTTPQQRVNQAGDVNLAAAKAGATTTAKENAKDIDEMLSDGAAAPVRQQQIDAAIRVLPTAGVGPGLASTKRAIANYFNIPIGETTPSSAQLAEAIDSQLRGSGIMGKNMRTQREFNTVMVGLPNMDQNPQTAAAVLNGVKNITSYKQKLHDDFLALPQEERTRMRGDQDAFQSWMAREGATFSHQMDSQGGVYAAPGSPALTAPNASSAPASAPPTAAPQGATSGTTRRGVTWVKNN